MIETILNFAISMLLCFVAADFDSVKSAHMASYKNFYDDQGQVLTRLVLNRNTQTADWLKLNKFSIHLQEAVIKIEDKRFWQHSGVDGLRFVSVIKQLARGQSIKAVSTLSMQTAKIIFPWCRRGYFKKIKQVFVAILLERSWSKQQILEVYLNKVPHRGSVVGLAYAAQKQFGVLPGQVTFAQAIFLVSALAQPNQSFESIAKRACKMQHNIWNQRDCCTVQNIFKEYDQFGYQPNCNHNLLDKLDLANKDDLANRSAKEKKTTLISRFDLNGIIDLKSNFHLPDSTLVKIKGEHLFLNLDLQNSVLALARKHQLDFEKQNLKDIAVVAFENATGRVVVYVPNLGKQNSNTKLTQGGYSQFADIDLIKSYRQSGSTLKPFLYALAFSSQIINKHTLLYDNPVSLTVGNGSYQPQNYDQQYQGAVTADKALAQSLNTPALNLLELVGVQKFYKLIQNLELSRLNSAEYYGPSLIMGTLDLTLWDLTRAYLWLARSGKKINPTWAKNNGNKQHNNLGLLNWVADAILNLFLHKTQTDADFINDLSAQGIATVTDILSSSILRAGGFGLNSALKTNFWSAVKTGTSQDMRDNWCVGFSKNYTVGVWAGDPAGHAMQAVTGVTGAAPVWNEVLTLLEKNRGINRGVRELANNNPYEHQKNNQISNLQTQWEESSELKILSPQSNEIYAFDPSLPPENQGVLVKLNQTLSKSFELYINGQTKLNFSTGHKSAIIDKLSKGRHLLEVRTAASGKVVDWVNFEVR